MDETPEPDSPQYQNPYPLWDTLGDEVFGEQQNKYPSVDYGGPFLSATPSGPPRLEDWLDLDSSKGGLGAGLFPGTFAISWARGTDALTEPHRFNTPADRQLVRSSQFDDPKHIYGHDNYDGLSTWELLKKLPAAARVYYCAESRAGLSLQQCDRCFVLQKGSCDVLAGRICDECISEGGRGEPVDCTYLGRPVQDRNAIGPSSQTADANRLQNRPSPLTMCDDCWAGGVSGCDVDMSHRIGCSSCRDGLKSCFASSQPLTLRPFNNTDHGGVPAYKHRCDECAARRIQCDWTDFGAGGQFKCHWCFEYGRPCSRNGTEILAVASGQYYGKLTALQVNSDRLAVQASGTTNAEIIVPGPSGSAGIKSSRELALKIRPTPINKIHPWSEGHHLPKNVLDAYPAAINVLRAGPAAGEPGGPLNDLGLLMRALAAPVTPPLSPSRDDPLSPASDYEPGHGLLDMIPRMEHCDLCKEVASLTGDTISCSRKAGSLAGCQRCSAWGVDCSLTVRGVRRHFPRDPNLLGQGKPRLVEWHPCRSCVKHKSPCDRQIPCAACRALGQSESECVDLFNGVPRRGAFRRSINLGGVEGPEYWIGCGYPPRGPGETWSGVGILDHQLSKARSRINYKTLYVEEVRGPCYERLPPVWLMNRLLDRYRSTRPGRVLVPDGRIQSDPSRPMRATLQEDEIPVLPFEEHEDLGLVFPEDDTTGLPRTEYGVVPARTVNWFDAFPHGPNSQNFFKLLRQERRDQLLGLKSTVDPFSVPGGDAGQGAGQAAGQPPVNVFHGGAGGDAGQGAGPAVGQSPANVFQGGAGGDAGQGAGQGAGLAVGQPPVNGFQGPGDQQAEGDNVGQPPGTPPHTGPGAPDMVSLFGNFEPNLASLFDDFDPTAMWGVPPEWLKEVEQVTNPEFGPGAQPTMLPAIGSEPQDLPITHPYIAGHPGLFEPHGIQRNPKLQDFYIPDSQGLDAPIDLRSLDVRYFNKEAAVDTNHALGRRFAQYSIAGTRIKNVETTPSTLDPIGSWLWAASPTHLHFVAALWQEEVAVLGITAPDRHIAANALNYSVMLLYESGVTQPRRDDDLMLAGGNPSLNVLKSIPRYSWTAVLGYHKPKSGEHQPWCNELLRGRPTAPQKVDIHLPSPSLAGTMMDINLPSVPPQSAVSESTGLANTKMCCEKTYGAHCEAIGHYQSRKKYHLCEDCSMRSACVVAESWGLTDILDMRMYACAGCAETRTNVLPTGGLPLNAPERWGRLGAGVWGVNQTYTNPWRPDGSKTVQAPDGTEAQVGGFRGAARPVTGCQCADKLLSRRLCGIHRFGLANKLLLQTALVKEWTLAVWAKMICPFCQLKEGVQVHNFRGVEGGEGQTMRAWGCIGCQEYVILGEWDGLGDSADGALPGWETLIPPGTFEHLGRTRKEPAFARDTDTLRASRVSGGLDHSRAIGRMGRDEMRARADKYEGFRGPVERQIAYEAKKWMESYPFETYEFLNKADPRDTFRGLLVPPEEDPGVQGQQEQQGEEQDQQQQQMGAPDADMEM